MARHTCDTPKFKRKQKVVAVIDLPGVPAGTVGKVYYEAGVTWFRYHVAFENGVEMGQVDGNALLTVADYEASLQEQRRAQLEAERDARTGEIQVSAGPRGH